MLLSEVYSDVQARNETDPFLGPPFFRSRSELKSRAPNNLIHAQLEEMLQEMNDAGM